MCICLYLCSLAFLFSTGFLKMLGAQNFNKSWQMQHMLIVTYRYNNKRPELAPCFHLLTLFPQSFFYIRLNFYTNDK